MGSLIYPSPRITDPESKYYVAIGLWKEIYYPPYVSGGGFVMSSLVAKKIFEVIKVTPIIPIDDAFMGICLKKLGLKPQDNRSNFLNWGFVSSTNFKKLDFKCIYQDIMTFHRFNDFPMNLSEQWFKMQSCNADDCVIHLSGN